MTLLVTILGSRNKITNSEFWNLTYKGYPQYKFRLRKVKTCVLLRKFHSRSNLTALLVTTLCSRKNGLRILRFDVLRVPLMQIPTKKRWTLSFVDKILLLKKLIAFHITNMWQIYTRPTSASDFLGMKSLKTWTFVKKFFFCKLNLYFPQQDYEVLDFADDLVIVVRGNVEAVILFLLLMPLTTPQDGRGPSSTQGRQLLFRSLGDSSSSWKNRFVIEISKKTKCLGVVFNSKHRFAD
jgi:hypothetical protein